MKVNRNFLFLIICVSILFLGMVSLVRNPKLTSSVENRNLTLFPNFTVASFLNLSYQNTLDSALSDQFIFGETIKSKMNKVTMLTDYTNLNTDVCPGNYVKVKDTVAVYNCDKRMVYLPETYDKKNEKKIKQNIDKLNKKLNDKLNLYYYFVNDSSNFDFRTNTQIYDFDKYLSDTNFSSLKFKNYKEFSKYFYKTDHHWNYNGSYKGYTDIIKMILGENEEILKPEKLVDFKVDFDGSLARTTNVLGFYDDFKGHKFSFSEHDESIDGKTNIYGEYKNYLNGKISDNVLLNHYGIFYGGDYGEVLFDYYNNSDKDNLLIVSNSFSNSVNNLIASHFHKTYVVDLRHYSNIFGTEFDYDEYIEKNDIDRVLILGHYSYFASEYLGV